jgi:hypothetical protein
MGPARRCSGLCDGRARTLRFVALAACAPERRHDCPCIGQATTAKQNAKNCTDSRPGHSGPALRCTPVCQPDSPTPDAHQLRTPAGTTCACGSGWSARDARSDELQNLPFLVIAARRRAHRPMPKFRPERQRISARRALLRMVGSRVRAPRGNAAARRRPGGCERQTRRPCEAALREPGPSRAPRAKLPVPASSNFGRQSFALDAAHARGMHQQSRCMRTPCSPSVGCIREIEVRDGSIGVAPTGGVQPRAAAGRPQ